MCGPQDPLFTPLLLLARVPFQAKESVHKTPFWENLEILASTASIFTQILAHKPPNFEIFSSQAPKFWNFQLTSPQIWKFSAHKPLFSEANVISQAPHFGNPGRTPLPKKVECPPPRASMLKPKWFLFYLAHKDVLKNKSKFGATMEIYRPTIIWVIVYVCMWGWCN